MNEVAKTVGIMAPPMKPWTSRHTIISLIEVDSPHIRLAAVKPAAETEKRIRVPKRARQKARERDHHHFGDEIGGLHPGNLVAAGGEPGLDLGQRGGDDLDVEDRHEHAEDHGEEGDETARLDPVGARRRGGEQPFRWLLDLPTAMGPRFQPCRRSVATLSVHSRASGNQGPLADLSVALGPRFRGDERWVDDAIPQDPNMLYLTRRGSRRCRRSSRCRVRRDGAGLGVDADDDRHAGAQQRPAPPPRPAPRCAPAGAARSW